MEKIHGRVWLLDDNVDTDQILPGYAMAEPAEKLAQFAMAGSKFADFAKLAQPGDIIVAGKNFGCGSSREQAPVALKSAGVGMIIATSLARIFRRNSINIGLPVMIADIKETLQHGELIAVDLETGDIQTETGRIKGQPLSENVLATIRAGGLINRVRQELNASSGRK
jgi:3-isopropylmalate dehydratase small subunit